MALEELTQLDGGELSRLRLQHDSKSDIVSAPVRNTLRLLVSIGLQSISSSVE